MTDLIGCQIALKKALPDKNKDIPTHIAMSGNYVPKGFRSVNLSTCPAVVQGLMSSKRTGHAKHSLPSGFLNKKRHAAGAALFSGLEPDDRGGLEQGPRQHIAIKPC